MIEALGRWIKVPLAQCQDSPIGPCSRFSGSNLRGLLKAGTRENIVADLESRESDVERRHKLLVSLGGSWGEIAVSAASDEGKRCKCENENRAVCGLIHSA